MILGCKEQLQQRIEAKPELVHKLDICLQEDVKHLFEEVEHIRVDAIQSWLISEESDRTHVLATLAELTEHLTELQEKSQEYRKYQREFKVYASERKIRNIVVFIPSFFSLRYRHSDRHHTLRCVGHRHDGGAKSSAALGH